MAPKKSEPAATSEESYRIDITYNAPEKTYSIKIIDIETGVELHYSLIKTLKDFGILKDELINIEGLWDTANQFLFAPQPGTQELSSRLNYLGILLVKALQKSKSNEQVKTKLDKWLR